MRSERPTSPSPGTALSPTFLRVVSPRRPCYGWIETDGHGPLPRPGALIATRAFRPMESVSR
jgi:hypothetical protein